MSRLDSLPRHGLLPIPYFTAVVNGKPDFRAHDSAKHRRAMVERLCGICGEALGKPFVLIFGPNSIRDLATYMPAMHAECAEESLRLCPYLARAERDRSQRETKLHSVVPAAEIPDKPDSVALVYAGRYEVIRANGSEYAGIYRAGRVRWFDYTPSGLVERETSSDA